MARLFPRRSETPVQDGQPRIVDLEGEDADAVFSALSSTTARRIYSCLDEDPGTPSDVADAIDSSIQNVRYHLENLEEAGLVEVVDTWYSSRGNEMSVYATTDGPLIVTSDESTGSRLKTALSRLIGGIGALAGGSMLVQYGLTQWIGSADGTGTGPDAGWPGPFGGGDDAAPADEADTAETDDAEDSDQRDAEDEAADDDTETEEDAADDDGGADEDEFDIAEADEEEDGDEAADDTTTSDADSDDVDSFDSEYDTGSGDGLLENASDGGAETTDAVLATVPPGLLFFLGGLVVLLGVTAYWYWRSRPVQ